MGQEQKLNPNIKDEHGALPLHAAVSEGSSGSQKAVQVVQELLDADADVNLPEEGGGLPLQIAAWKGHVDVAKLLLKASAAVNACNERGCSPLCSAVRQGHKNMVELLLEYGADPEKPAKSEGTEEAPLTPLRYAQLFRKQEIAKDLQAARERRGTSCFSMLAKCCLCWRSKRP